MSRGSGHLAWLCVCVVCDDGAPFASASDRDAAEYLVELHNGLTGHEAECVENVSQR